MVQLSRIGSATRRAVLAAAIVATPAFGATYNYTGTSTGDVNVASNWSGGIVPTTGDVAVFDGATASGVLTLTNSGTVTTTAPGLTLSITSPAALTIDSTAALFRLGNTSLTVESGAGAFSWGNAAGTVVSYAMGQGASTQTLTNNSASTATINTDVMLTPGNNGNHVLVFTGSGNWQLNNPIANTGTDKTQTNGLFAVTKSGTGTATLANNANIFSGNAVINNGTLKAAANNALGFSGQYSLNRAVGTTTVDGSANAATLEIAGGVTVNEPIVLSGGTNGANLVNNTVGTTGTVGNGVAAITFSNAGAGYGTSTGFNSLVTTITGGGGTGATGTAWKGSSAGTGVNVTFVTNAGSGYTSVPTVTVTGVNGEAGGAVATAVLSSVTLTGTNNNIGGDGNLNIAAVIGQSAAGAGFNKIGTGTLTLAGANTYSGTTTVAAGALVVNGTVAGPVVVNGGSLGGGGTVGAVTLGSTAVIAPGNSIGTLTAASTAFGSGSTYAAEIGAGTAADLLAVTGTLDLSAAGDTLNLIGVDANFDGSTKTIATYASLLGTFDVVTLNGLALVGTPAAFVVNGQTYAVDYGTGTSSAITVTPVVPEPAALAGLAIAGLGLMARRRAR
ncbi:MAG: autotransporter-associated beta strand repeat-containing protein [Tepidisphaeraceae bacterium]